ncbi:MAG: hypothetical protein RLZZ76_417 [Candidatus Parcubacteria bacterium]|jgi:hypothetical protein
MEIGIKETVALLYLCIPTDNKKIKIIFYSSFEIYNALLEQIKNFPEYKIKKF